MAILVPEASRAASPEMSLAGLYFGMTSKEVQTAITPKYQIDIRHGSDPNLVLVVGQTTDKTDDLVLGFANDKLWYIKHAVDFAPGKEPTVNGFKKQITDKFGPMRGDSGPYHTWVFNLAGEQVAGPSGIFPQDYYPCVSIEQQNINSASQEAENGRVEQGFASNCGFEASSAWQTDPQNMGLVQHMLIAVSDAPYMYNYLSTRKNREAKRKQEDIEKAAKNAAPL